MQCRRGLAMRILSVRKNIYPSFLTSMTLNDLERRNSPYFVFFSRNSTDFQADCITVVEDRPIMSVNHCLPVPVFYFWQKL